MPPDREQVRAIVAGEWGLPGAETTDHGGMNSATWFVTRGDQRWVAEGPRSRPSADRIGEH